MLAESVNTGSGVLADPMNAGIGVLAEPVNNGKFGDEEDAEGPGIRFDTLAALAGGGAAAAAEDRKTAEPWGDPRFTLLPDSSYRLFRRNGGGGNTEVTPEIADCHGRDDS